MNRNQSTAKPGSRTPRRLASPAARRASCLSTRESVMGYDESKAREPQHVGDDRCPECGGDPTGTPCCDSEAARQSQSSARTSTQAAIAVGRAILNLQVVADGMTSIHRDHRGDLAADVRAILQSGLDPVAYRRALAAARGVDVSEVDAVIAAVGGTPRQVSAETVAQERLAEERRHDAAWRVHDGEEETA